MIAHQCVKSYTDRHRPHYDNGAVVFTDDAGLRAVCQHCEQPIQRAHRHSAWWFVRAEETKS